MKTSARIIEFLRQNGSASGSQLAMYLGLGDRAVRKQLKALLDGGRLTKTGTPPKVFYLLSPETTDAESLPETNIDDTAIDVLIEREFVCITAAGVMLYGWPGFKYWCGQHGLDATKTAERYRLVHGEYARRKPQGWLDGMYKMRLLFDEVPADEVLYLEADRLDMFGPTKLAQLVAAAKRSQDNGLAGAAAQLVRPAIERLMAAYQIDAVGFVPPAIKRQPQFMVRLQQQLGLAQPQLAISRRLTPVAVGQSDLANLDDRMTNARSTISVEAGTAYRNVLLIDDHLDSGATLHETARQIHVKGVCRERLVVLALTGNPQVQSL